MVSKYDKSELEKLILEEKRSYEEIGRMFNVTGVAIKKAALRLNIELLQRRCINKCETFKREKKIENKKGICINCGQEFSIYASKLNKYCSNKCQGDYEHKELYAFFLSGDKYFQRANYSCGVFKKDILLEQNNKCAKCGIEPMWNNKELIFVLDHIDGDASHNTRENLRMICPNCDSQLDTYKSKNKNGARHYYRYKK